MDKDLQPSNYIFLCSQCNEVPLCHLISPTEISFRCSCSHKEIQLENVFNYFSFAREVPQICRTHNGKFYCYCETCHCNCCYQCVASHSAHSLIKFKSLKSKINNRNLLSEFEEAKRHLEREHSRIKSEIVQELRNKIKKIEDAYRRNEERNRKICRFVAMVLNAYESTKNIPNYHIVKNLIDNTHYSKASFEQTVNANELTLANKVNACIDFFNTNHIIHFNLIRSLYTTEHITSLALLSDKTIACGCQSGSILLYTKTTLTDTLRGHTAKVNHLSQLTYNRLLSSSQDNTIKLWQKSLHNFKCEATFTGHSCSVSKSIQIDDLTIASCSYDTTVRLWSLTAPYQCLSTLRAHRREVTSLLLLSDGRLVSNSLDSSTPLLFWDLRSGTPLGRKIRGLGISGERNKMYQLDPHRIVLDNTSPMGCHIKDVIYVVNVNTYQIEQHIMIDDEYIKTFCLKGEMLYIGCDKGKFYKYDTRRNEYKKMPSHRGFISDIFVDSENVYTCSIKGEIKILSK